MVKRRLPSHRHETTPLANTSYTHKARSQMTRTLDILKHCTIPVIHTHGALESQHIAGAFVRDAAFTRGLVALVDRGPVLHTKCLHIVFVGHFLVHAAWTVLGIKHHVLTQVRRRGSLLRVKCSIARHVRLEHDRVWPRGIGVSRRRRQFHHEHTGSIVGTAAFVSCLLELSARGRVAPPHKGLVHAAVVAIKCHVVDADEITFVGHDGSFMVSVFTISQFNTYLVTYISYTQNTL